MSRYIYFLAIVLLSSCSVDDLQVPVKPLALGEVPAHFSVYEIPDDNVYTEKRWALGKRLFYDNMMSVDSSISCATCHKSDLAFSDDVSLSDGVFGRAGTSNAPSLANVAYHPYFTREGGVPTLEMQILVPIQEHNEFDFNIVYIADRMNQDSSYVAQSLLAYDRRPDPFVITRALANFERTLISATSRYDSYRLEREVLSQEELLGQALFYSEELSCGACHAGELFTDFSFKNNGLYQSYESLGRMRLTGLESDRAVFKVPSLRNIELTRPYMHDGSLLSLDEVIEHYAQGGVAHPNKSAAVKGFNITDREKDQLVSFLKTLTDRAFVSDDRFK